MTISLLTRGYVCFREATVIPPIGAGPSVVSADDVVPSLTGAATELDDGPSIVGSAQQVPTISGATSDSGGQAPDSPTISGGGVLTPNIDGSEEV